jgi:hypothetical protein
MEGSMKAFRWAVAILLLPVVIPMFLVGFVGGMAFGALAVGFTAAVNFDL